MKTFSILFIFTLLLTACGSTEKSPVSDVPKTEKTILALGDSLTAGLGLPIESSYPSQLEAKLREKSYAYRIINAGISGDTTAGLLSRMDWVLDGENSPDKGGTGGFALVILCIGANDAFQGKSIADIETNIRAIIEKIQATKIPILFAGMRAPLNLGGDYGREYEAIFPKLAKEYDLSFMPFLLTGVALDAKLNQDDRIHPTREGYAIVVENIMKILEKEDLIVK